VSIIANPRPILGLCLALGLPTLALVESHVRHELSPLAAAFLLGLTPWLVVLWVTRIERRPLSSIGLRRPDARTLAYGIAGIVLNVAISVVFSALAAKLGMREEDSGFSNRLIAGGYGWLLVILATNGAVMTEIAFRAYALERLSELIGNRWLAAAVQLALTGGLFLVSRPAHLWVWLVDDVVFTAFYFWRRDTIACLLAHGLPNLVASLLAALRLVD